MSKFNVMIYYHGCFNAEIEANNESEALEIARTKAYTLDDAEFLRAIEVMEEGHDVELCR